MTAEAAENAVAMVPPVPDFDPVLRGYDRGQVDTYLRKLRSQLEHTIHRVTELEQELEQARRFGPSRSGLPVTDIGAHINAVLTAAEEQARQIEDEAQCTADALKERSETEAAELRAQADQYAADVRAEADREATRRREETEEALSRRLAEAEVQAIERIAEAERHAEEIDSRAGKVEEERAATMDESRRRAAEMLAAAERRADDKAEEVVVASKKEGERLVEQARTEARQLLTDAENRMRQLAAEAGRRQERRAEAVRQVVDIAEKLRDAVEAVVSAEGPQPARDQGLPNVVPAEREEEQLAAPALTADGRGA